MLKEQIQADLITAMKSKDTVTVQTLRLVKSAILKYETSGENMVVDDEKLIQILKKELKQRKDSITQFEKGGREDLVEVEKAEAAVLEKYIPAQLPKEEVVLGVKQLAEELGAATKADFGKLMGASMAKFKGQVDGSIVRAAVEEILQ